MDCQHINFSNNKSETRISRASSLLGSNVVKWIIGFALFLLGAQRREISVLIQTPYETYNSFINRIFKKGIKAFEDQRRSHKGTVKTPKDRVVHSKAEILDDQVIIRFQSDLSTIKIPNKNSYMAKAVLFSLLQNQLLDPQSVAKILGYTKSHTLYIRRKIESGSTDVLFDKRAGQKQEFIFKPEVKAELIQQCAANSFLGESTSSKVLVEGLKKRCCLDLSERSVRYHIQKLGLKNITQTLPKIISELKKNSEK